MTLQQPRIIAGKSVSDEIIESLRMLYSVTEGSQPLDRGLGLDIGVISKPLDIFINEYTLDVIEKTEKYEPRVVVTDVSYDKHDSQGSSITPVIRLRMADEEGSADE